MLHKKIFAFNPLFVNCCVIWNDNKSGIIVDPSCYSNDEQNTLVKFIEANEIKVKHIIITHYHFDHLMGAAFVSNLYGIPLTAHKDYVYLSADFDIKVQTQFFGFSITMPPKPKVLLSGDEQLVIDNDVIQVLHVPGHSPCSIALYAPNDNFVITGDALFEGSIGRTDLPYGDFNKLLESIRKKLLTLPDNTLVIPGHGDTTTIEIERKYNTFIG